MLAAAVRPGRPRTSEIAPGSFSCPDFGRALDLGLPMTNKLCPRDSVTEMSGFRHERSVSYDVSIEAERCCCCLSCAPLFGSCSLCSDSLVPCTSWSTNGLEENALDEALEDLEGDLEDIS